MTSSLSLVRSLSLASLLLACERGHSEAAKPAPVTAETHAASPAQSSVSAGSAEPQPSTAEQQLLAPGSPLPDVSAVAQTGERVNLPALKGKPVVVYFYPKDETPGCTIEAEELRDLWQEIRREDAVVIGVSTDDEASHRAFAEKHALPFLLLPDPKHDIAAAFHVPLKNERAQRTTFVFGADGRLARVFANVQPKGHGQEILSALRSAKTG